MKPEIRMSPLVTGFLIVLSLSGCSSSTTQISNSLDESAGKKPAVYSVAFRQTAPQPVYNRLRFVHLPEVLPSRELPQSAGGLISPMVHLELKDASLEEASAVLASVARYSSYCASSVAEKRITVNALGTLDELADQISSKAGIQVVVDHSTRQVRFLSGTLAGATELPNAEAEAPKAQYLPQ